MKQLNMRRILSFALAVCMVIALAPETALAAPAAVAPSIELNAGLVYTGEELQLIKNASLESETGTLSFAIGESAESAGTDPSWQTEVSALTAVNAGDYYVWYKVEDSAGADGIDATYSGTVTIAKAQATATAPTALNPAFTGSEQVLISAGSTDFGQMEYALTEDTSAPADEAAWKTSADEIKGTAVGDYHVWYRVKDDESGNYTGVEATQVAGVKITKATQAAPGSGEGYTINFEAETLTIQDGFEVSSSQGDTGELGTGASITPYIGKSLYIRRTGDESKEASPWTAISVPDRPNAPSLSSTDETTYQGNNGQITGTDDTMEYQGPGAGEWTTCTGDMTNLAPGEYKIRLKATSTAFYGKETSITIKSAPHLTVTDVDFNDVKYGATTEAQTLTIANDGGSDATITEVKMTAGEDSFTVTTGSDQNVAASGSNATYKIELKPNLAVGSHTGTVSVTYDGGQTTTANVSVNITKAAPSVTPPTATNPTYTGAEQVLISAGTATGGTMKYYVGEIAPGTDSSDWKTDVNEIKGTEAKSYKVWYYVDGGDNYESTAVASIDASIQQATPAVTVTAPEGPLTYGDQITLTAKVTVSGVDAGKLAGKVQFKVNDTPIGNPVDVSTGTATLTISANDQNLQHTLFGTNGQNIKITATYSGDPNIAEKTSAEKTVTVQPKELTFTFTPETKTYDETKTVKGILSGPEGLVSGDTVQADFTAEAESADVGTDIKVTVTVTLGGTDKQYYTAQNPAGVTVEIVKAGSSAAQPTGASGLEYNGTEQELIRTAGTATGGEMKYYVGNENPGTGTEDWKTDISDIKGKDAGTYKVWYYVAGDKNHNDTTPASITVEIGKKEVELEWSSTTEFTYNGSEQGVTATVKTGVDGEALNATLENDKNIDANSYTAKVIDLVNGEGGDADNYKLPEAVTQSYTIKKATVSVDNVKKTSTYNTQPQTVGDVTVNTNGAPPLTQGSDYSVTYRANSDESGETAANGSETNVGTYGVWVELTSENAKKNYEFEGANEKAKVGTMEITKATLTLEVAGEAITYGDTLRDSALEGTAKIQGTETIISGTWAWDATDGAKYPAVSDSNNTEYTVKFTPTSSDEGNFTPESLSTKIKITVNPFELTPVVDSVDGKTYDGNTTAQNGKLKFAEDLAGAPFNINVPMAEGAFTFTDKNVGTNKTVEVTGIRLTENAGNYKLKSDSITGGETSAEITAKEVTLTWQDDEGLTYDGKAKNVTATTKDFVADDNVSLTYTDNDKINAGTYTAEAALTGDDAKNYVLSNASREYTIKPAEVSFAIGGEQKAAWPTDETNADPNPSGYAVAGSGTAYALTMTYDSYQHKAAVAQTAGEAVAIDPAEANGYTVTYKKDGAELEKVRDAGTYEIWVTINPVEGGDTYNYAFSGQDADTHALQIGTIEISPYEVTVIWTHLSYVYHAHPMHPDIRVQDAFNADRKQLPPGQGLPSGFDTGSPDSYDGEYLVAFAETDGSDVGDHPVTVGLYGQNGGNYTVKNPEATVSIVPAPVTFTVSDNVWDLTTTHPSTVTLSAVWGVVDNAPDKDEGTDHQYPAAGTPVRSDLRPVIVYKKDGAEVTAPTDPGTYEVWVEIGNPNFRHSATTDGASHKVGELVLTNDPGSVKTYTVTLDAGYEGGTAPEGMEKVLEGQMVILPEGLTREGYIFQGWSYNGAAYRPNEEFPMPAVNVTFKAEWLAVAETRTVSGTVLQEAAAGGEAAPRLGATVTLKQGALEMGETITGADGAFTFDQLAPGIYNLEIRYFDGSATVVKTFRVDVEKSDMAGETYTLPAGALNTVVEADVTAVVDLEGVADSGLYTDADRQTVLEDHGTVEFKMTVKGTEATPDQIEEIPVPEEQIGMVLELGLTKTVTGSTSGHDGTTTITDATTLITTVIHLPAELQGKSSYTIYRFHAGEMQTITAGPNADGECLKVIRDGTAIELKAKYYSTYVLTWYQSSGGPTSYAVDLPAETVHGTVTADRRTAAQGTYVTLTVIPDEGYTVDQVTVTDHFGGTVWLIDNGDGTYRFAMPYGGAAVSVTFKEKGETGQHPADRFIDVAPGQWYYDAVDYVVAKGLMDGMTPTTFEPYTGTSRAMLVTILWRLEGRPEAAAAGFTDVPAGRWYSEAIAWAAANKVVDGYGDGTFRPDQALTRQEAAAILYRYAALKGYDLTARDDLSAYTDAGSVQSWAKDYIQWAVGTGLITGITETTLVPAGGAVRAQVAAILMRFCENVVK